MAFEKQKRKEKQTKAKIRKTIFPCTYFLYSHALTSYVRCKWCTFPMALYSAL